MRLALAIGILGFTVGCTPASAERVDEVADAAAPLDAADDGPGPKDAPLTPNSTPANFGGDGGSPWPLLIAVGNDGRHLISTDGMSWAGDTREVMSNSDTGPRALRGVAYADEMVVAVGGGCDGDCQGRLVIFDGRDWTEVVLPAGTGRLNGVAFGAGVWVAVGTQGPILRSTDGAHTWQQTSAPGPTGLRGVAFGRVGGQDMFVAVGDGYTRARSLDGLTWTDVAPSSGTPDGFRLAIMGNDVVVAVGGRSGMGRRVRSADGITWTSDLVGDADLLSLIYTDDNFMAFSSTGENTMYSSPDGITWATQMTSNAGAVVATGLLGGQRLFISRLAPSTIRSSTDGLNWTTTLMSLPRDATINAFVFAP